LNNFDLFGEIGGDLQESRKHLELSPGIWQAEKPDLWNGSGHRTGILLRCYRPMVGAPILEQVQAFDDLNFSNPHVRSWA
jgi:hypothetical protein